MIILIIGSLLTIAFLITLYGSYRVFRYTDPKGLTCCLYGVAICATIAVLAYVMAIITYLV